MRNDITIRPELHTEFNVIDEMVLRSFREGTKSDGSEELALIHEIRSKKYYIPQLSFVAVLGEQIVGHFMFSHFPISQVQQIGNYDKQVIKTLTLMLAPVAVHASYFRQDIGRTMLRLGIEKIKVYGYKGIQVEGNPKFYNQLGFQKSSNFFIYPTVGYPLKNPECMMVQETYHGSLNGIKGYIDYSMYQHA